MAIVASLWDRGPSLRQLKNVIAQSNVGAVAVHHEKSWGSDRPLLGDRHRVERRIGRIQGFLSYTEQGERNMRDLIGKV